MKKVYIYEMITSVLLLSVIELYFWSQSRSQYLDNNNGTKIGLIALYILIAVSSQAIISAALKLEIRDSVMPNLVVAVLVSLGLTALAFFIHPAVLKDVSEGWVNAVKASMRFFATIGLVTFLTGLLGSATSMRTAKI